MGEGNRLPGCLERWVDNRRAGRPRQAGRSVSVAPSPPPTHVVGERQVGVEEGLDGTNVLPVAVEQVGHDLQRVEEGIGKVHRAVQN